MASKLAVVVVFVAGALASLLVAWPFPPEQNCQQFVVSMKEAGNQTIIAVEHCCRGGQRPPVLVEYNGVEGRAIIVVPYSIQEVVAKLEDNLRINGEPVTVVESQVAADTASDHVIIVRVLVCSGGPQND